MTRITRMLMAVPVAAGLLASAAPVAHADWYHRGYEHGGYYHRGGGWGAGPAIAGAIVGLGVGAALAAPRYYAPPPVVYAPPPAYYAPPPAYYAPPPPAYYAPY